MKFPPMLAALALALLCASCPGLVADGAWQYVAPDEPPPSAGESSSDAESEEPAEDAQADDA